MCTTPTSDEKLVSTGFTKVKPWLVHKLVSEKG